MTDVDAKDFLMRARSLLNFALNFKGLYHEAIPDSANYYKSWSGYNDEILLAAVWIAKASQKLEPEAFLKDLGTDCRRGKIV